MKILIVEDEHLLSEYLVKKLVSLGYEQSKMYQAYSVKDTIAAVQSQEFDIAFFDIELEDGTSFDIFEQSQIDFPVIFTTAYHQYAIDAFKFNSIDYLLKPIEDNALHKALGKYEKLWKPKVEATNSNWIHQLRAMMEPQYKTRFVSKIGDRIKLIDASDIHLVYSKHKGTYIYTNKSFLVDYSLERLQEMLDPKVFFRINRQQLVSIKAIKDIISFSSSRLKVELNINYEEELIVSRDKVSSFKKWLEGQL